VISLLDLGVERPRDAMMPRAPETEALYEGRDPGSVGRVSLKLSGVQDPEHALCLCVELARAYEALRLGRKYEQNKPLSI
jgi:dihydropteroate synthase